MKRIRKDLLPIGAMLAFIGAYIGAAQADNYYYYENLPGLMSASSDFPFCETDVCTYDNPTSVDIEITSRLVKAALGADINNSYSFLSGSADVEAVVSYGSIIATGDIDHDEVNNTITVDSGDIVGSGSARITITASVDGEAVDQDYFEIEVADYACNTTEPLDSGFMCGDGICDDYANDIYLIGEIATGSDPIVAKQQLLCLSNYQTANVIGADYKLMSDVDFYSNYGNEDWNLSGSSDGPDAEGWIPLGNLSNTFSGDFNGNGHVINNLYINRPSSNHQAFFGIVDSNNITSLGLENLLVNANGMSGGLVGYSTSISIDECYVSGEVSGSFRYLGLLGGYVHNGSVINSYSSGDVIAGGNYYIGGLIGGGSGTIKNTYSLGSVITTTRYVGGLIGEAGNSTDIYSSYSEAYIEGGCALGGLVGQTWATGIHSSYATGNVTATSTCMYPGDVGGLVGSTSSLAGSQIRDSYSTGTVQSTKYPAGGLVATLAGSPIYNSYAYWSTAPGPVSSPITYVGGLVGRSLSGATINNGGVCDDAGDASTTPNIVNYECDSADANALTSIQSMQSSWNTNAWINAGISGVETPSIDFNMIWSDGSGDYISQDVWDMSGPNPALKVFM